MIKYVFLVFVFLKKKLFHKQVYNKYGCINQVLPWVPYKIIKCLQCVGLIILKTTVALGESKSYAESPWVQVNNFDWSWSSHAHFCMSELVAMFCSSHFISKTICWSSNPLASFPRANFRGPSTSAVEIDGVQRHPPGHRQICPGTQ